MPSTVCAHHGDTCHGSTLILLAHLMKNGTASPCDVTACCHRLVTALPPGFSLDWSYDFELPAWVLTLTDRRGTEYVQHCVDGEGGAGRGGGGQESREVGFREAGVWRVRNRINRDMYIYIFIYMGQGRVVRGLLRAMAMVSAAQPQRTVAVERSSPYITGAAPSSSWAGMDLGSSQNRDVFRSRSPLVTPLPSPPPLPTQSPRLLSPPPPPLPTASTCSTPPPPHGQPASRACIATGALWPISSETA